MAGYTGSDDFPVTPFAFQRTLNPGGSAGPADAFVMKMALGPATTFSVEGIFPRAGGNNGTVTATIIGSGFHNGATVTLRGAGGVDVIGEHATVGTDGRIITAVFDLHGAMPGVRDVFVTNTDGTSITLRGGFTVQDGGSPDIRVEILGRSVLRFFESTTISVVVSNHGNADAVGVPVWITLPSGYRINPLFRVNPPPLALGVPPIPWSAIPTVFDVTEPAIPTDIVIGHFVPLFVPVISAGGAVTLQFRLSNESINTGPLPFSAWACAPFFRSPISPGAVDCGLAVIDVVASVLPELLARLVPGGGCAIAMAAHYTSIATQIAQIARASGDSEIIFSLSQFFVDVIAQGITLSAECAVSGTPVGMVFTIAEAVGSVLSLVAEHDVLEECFGAGIPSVRNLTLLGSRDPNALVGPAGVTTAAYLSPGSVLGYGVFFENQPDATAPAARVVVSARLDANLDLNSIRLVGVVVNDQSVALPPTFLPAVGLNTVHTTIDLRPGLDLLLRIDVNLNASARVLVWQFDSLDPLTGLPTTDPLAGFLRPGAEGSVFFTITPNPGLMTDTQIRNEADIVFDQNPAMSTNDWVNTIDADAPMSRVNALPALTTSMTFSVSWTVTDIGSGPGSISVFVSDNGGPYSAFQTDTSASSATFAGEPDHIYAFYSVARDLVGNREASKSEAEAMTQVVLVKPNLQVSGLSGKAVAGAGAPYVVSNTIKNVGDALATSSATKFFLSNDATWDAGDILLEPIGGRSVPELAVGATNKTTTQVTIPAETPTAKRFLIAYVDADGAIDESSEIDNTKAKAIYIGPDIVVSKLTGPAAAASGQVISVTDTTANVGGAPTTIVTTTRFYLSRNKKLDGSDIPLGPGRSVAVLAAGTPSTASTDLTIPVGTAVGAYFILANADDGAAQVESRENNNVKALAINVN